MKEIKVTLLSEDKARLELVEPTYWIYYNQLTYKANATVQLQINVEADSCRVRSGCMACTTSNILKSEENKHTIEITYDTKNIGDFTKTVTFFYTIAGKEESVLLKITGNVAR